MPFPTLPAPLARALSDRGYADPTPVQAAVLEAAAGDRDLLVSAQTGSGKTVAYGLAMAGMLIGDAEALPPAGAPLALVIAPTRELALQVQRELFWLYGPAGGRITACVGGMDPRRESRMLAEGTHIVVGTPAGCATIWSGATSIRPLCAPWSSTRPTRCSISASGRISSSSSRRRRRSGRPTCSPRPCRRRSSPWPSATSATALRLAIKSETRGHADIAYRAVRIMPRETEHVVLNLLREADAATAIVFCNTRNAVRHLQANLTERGFSVVALSGELGQGERNAALQALRDGRARVCVATDVAARGIDLPSLSLVIHADLPHDAEVLQHRSGRTGRAGRKGTSVLLIPEFPRRRAEQMFAIAKVSPEWSGPPSADEIRRLDGERMLSDPLFAEPPAEEDVALAGTLLASKSPEELAALLARVYRTRLPAPEEVSDPGEGRAPRGERPPYDPMDPERIAAMGPAVWFRLNLGRRDNADPRRLLPMLTRRGGIGRQEIGAIRIFDRETKFEVRGNAAARFAEAFARNGSPEIQVEALAGEGAPAERPGRGGPKGFASPRAGKHQRKVERTGPRPDNKPDRHSGRG